MSGVPEVRPGVSAHVGTILHSSHRESNVDSALAEDERPFDTLIHETEIHIPVAVLDISEDGGIQGELTDCLDMPIRLKGQEHYSIPENWSSLVPAIQKLIDIEHANNPHWSDYYTYMSIHYTPDLIAGKQQRHGGCHTDGFQGAREPERTKGSRSYVAVTNGGTRYFPQKFVASLDSAKFNVFEGFDLQVERDSEGRPIFGIAEENLFYFFDAYTVHESGSAERDGARLFIRLTWEMKLFDRAGNAKNAMLDYNWTPVDYDIRADLITPTVSDIEAARKK